MFWDELYSFCLQWLPNSKPLGYYRIDLLLKWIQQRHEFSQPTGEQNKEFAGELKENKKCKHSSNFTGTNYCYHQKYNAVSKVCDGKDFDCDIFETK